MWSEGLRVFSSRTCRRITASAALMQRVKCAQRLFVVRHDRLIRPLKSGVPLGACQPGRCTEQLPDARVVSYTRIEDGWNAAQMWLAGSMLTRTVTQVMRHCFFLLAAAQWARGRFKRDEAFQTHAGH